MNTAVVAIPVVLIPAQYAPNSTTTVYTAPTGQTIIIDNFSVGNNDSSAHTISINIVTANGSAGATNLVVDAQSFPATGTAGSSGVVASMQNQILNPGDFIAVAADSASKLVIRASGRECA